MGVCTQQLFDELILMASHRNWTLTQLAPYQNSSVQPSADEQLIANISRFDDNYNSEQ
jgi:hypothetical protein